MSILHTKSYSVSRHGLNYRFETLRLFQCIAYFGPRLRLPVAFPKGGATLFFGKMLLRTAKNEENRVEGVRKFVYVDPPNNYVADCVIHCKK